MKRIVLSFALLLCAAAPLRGPFAPVRNAWSEARESGDPGQSASAFDRAIAAGPGNRRLRLDAAEATTDPARKVRLFERLIEIGGTLDPATADRATVGMTGPDRSRILAALAANARPIARSSPQATIASSAPHIEAVAHDPRRGCLYLASTAGRSLYAQCGGQLRKLPMSHEVGPILGMVFDPANDRIWFVSSAIFGETTAPTGLFAYDLKTAAVRQSIGPAEKMSLGDIALGRDGEVFAGDSESGAIYRARFKRPIEVVVAPGLLRSAQGMALSADGRSLYVADYAYGLARVDLASGGLRAVAVAPSVGLDGIDGLLRHGQDLVAIQNGWQPARILRLRLSPDGDRVDSAEIIDRAHPAHEDPTHGTIVGDRLLYVANSQWPRYDEKGQLKPGLKQAPTTILGFSLAR